MSGLGTAQPRFKKGAQSLQNYKDAIELTSSM